MADRSLGARLERARAVSRGAAETLAGKLRAMARVTVALPPALVVATIWLAIFGWYVVAGFATEWFLALMFWLDV